MSTFIMLIKNNMASLNINRPWQIQNLFSKFAVIVDGEQIGALWPGETKEFEVDEGPHVINTKTKWHKSQDLSINVTSNQNIKLKVGVFNTPYRILLFLFWAAMTTRLFLSDIQYARYKYVLLIFIAIVLVNDYYVKKDKYLTIKETSSGIGCV